MQFVFVDMALDVPLVSSSPRLRIAMVGSAWFGQLCGGLRFDLVPGDLVVLDGSVVNSWQRVVAFGAGEDVGHARDLVVCLG